MFSLSDSLKSPRRGILKIFRAALSDPARVLTNQIAYFTVVIMYKAVSGIIFIPDNNTFHKFILKKFLLVSSLLR